MKGPSFFKRKQYLINPPFQLRFIAYNVATAVIISLVFYGAIRYFFEQLNGFGQAAGLPPGHVFFEFIKEQVRLMNMVFLGTVALTTVILFLHGLFLSHRIAGPLHRLRTHMQRIAEGAAPSPVNFRKKDFFPELAEAYNKQLKVPVEKTPKAAA